MQQYSTVQSRNLILAEREMLKHAMPIKVLSTFGDTKPVPKNKTDTVVFRRALPIDAGANGAPNVDIAKYRLQEGQTPGALTIQYQDVQVTLQQYGVLMKFSSKSEDLYEDDIPGDMVKAVGEHMGTIEELIAFASLRAGSNVVFANGAARNAVNSKISLSRLRRCARAIENAHGSRCSERLAGSVNYATSPIEAAYLVFVHTDVESDVRDLPGFVPLAKYGSQKPAHEREIGSCEQFRFITSPYFKPFVAAGAAAAAGTILSNGETNTGGGELADVYPLIVMAKSAWGQVALKGKDSVAATHLPASQRNHANPLGQFGYVGADFWKAAVRLNEQWMVRLEVAASAL